MDNRLVSEEEKGKIALGVKREMERGTFNEELMARASIEFGPSEESVRHGYAKLRYQSTIEDLMVIRKLEAAPEQADNQPATKPHPTDPLQKPTLMRQAFGGEWNFPGLIAIAVTLPGFVFMPANFAVSGQKFVMLTTMLMAAIIGAAIAWVGTKLRKGSSFNRMFWTTYALLCLLVQFGWRQ